MKATQEKFVVRPEHGAERNRRVERKHTKQKFETTSGKPFEVSYCSSELSVAEKFCSHCDEWVCTKPLGIFGFVMCPKCSERW